jgi:acyl-CoA synthetase (AMP-forming)/AMP-acid ligase II
VAIGMNAAEYVLAGGLAVAGPDKPAIVSGDGSVTYGELTVRVSRLAAALREIGMNPGDRVAMLMLDHSDLVALYLAIIAAGGVAITLSTRATSDDLRHILAIVRPFAVVAESDFAPAVAAGMAPGAKLFLRERHVQSWVQRSETEFVPCARKPNDPAYWVMTSGTTGQPKAVEHRHDNVCACTPSLLAILKKSIFVHRFDPARTSPKQNGGCHLPTWILGRRGLCVNSGSAKW